MTFIYRSIDLKRFCVNNWWTRQWLICQQSRWNLKVRAGECLVNPLSSQRKQKTWIFQGHVVLGVTEDEHLDVPDSDHHHPLWAQRCVFIGKSTKYTERAKQRLHLPCRKKHNENVSFFFFPVGRWWGFLGDSDGKESACNVGDLGSISGLGRSTGKGNDSPPHYSCLENPMDRGAWRAAVHGVVKSQTWLSDSHTHTGRLQLLHLSLLGLHGRCVSSGWLVLCSLPIHYF